MYSPTRDIFVDDDDITVVTSNVSEGSPTSLALAGTEVTRMPPHKLPKWGYAAMTIASNEAIAESGATQIFFVDCIPIHNRQQTTCPLKVALADGRRVMSTHMCNIIIPGLPPMLVGHIILELSIASLFGIRVLTAAGCTVTFESTNALLNTMKKLF